MPPLQCLKYSSRNRLIHSNCEARTKPLSLKLKSLNSLFCTILIILLPLRFLASKISLISNLALPQPLLLRMMYKISQSSVMKKMSDINKAKI